MKKYIILFLCCFLSLALLSCGNNTEEDGDDGMEKFTFTNDSIQIEDTLSIVNKEKAHVVLLYGQSNAVGITQCGYLQQTNPDKYNEYTNGYDNVYINYFNDEGHPNTPYGFYKCILGCGASGCFGPEMGIVEKLHNKYNGEKVFIIKRAWGATALKNEWLKDMEARGDIYNSAMDFTLKSLNYLKNKGYTISIEGICWMQGETDTFCCNQKQYLYCTQNFVKFLRYDLKNFQKEIKFIDALIGYHWNNAEAINDAKIVFEVESNLNYLLDTTELTTNLEPTGNPDLPHYDSLSMVKLGQLFGDCLTN